MAGDFSYQLSADAEIEYIEFYSWYETQQEALGERFAKCVRKKLHTISTNPFLFSNKKGRYHEVYLGKPFPFVIVYVIDRKQQLIIVTTIFHTSRHPKLKYKRR